MRSLKSLVVGALALVGAGLAAGSAFAAGPPPKPPCGVSGITSASLGDYDPFAPTGFNNIAVTLNLTRVNNGNDKTQQVDFYVVRPPSAQYAGFDVLDPNNGNQSVMHLDGTQTLSLPSPPATGTVYYNFGGAAQPDTVPFPLLVTVPPNLDVTAGSNFQFDIRYICTGTGGLGDVNTPTLLTNSITLTVHIKSALTASYVGPAFDFGELVTVTPAMIAAAPATYTRSGNIRVASSGPYTVALDSAATNKYRMTYAGGSTSTAGQYIPFDVTFLGQTVSNASSSFTTITCQAATLAGQNLPISAKLNSGADGGGAGKTPAPLYQDTLTVTVTPLAAGASGQQACATL